MGALRNATSSITSARTPPEPTITTGPNTGSRRTPRMHSTPLTIGATSVPRISALAWNAAARATSVSCSAAAFSGATSSATPPDSVLCAMSGDRTFIATGAPIAPAICAASSELRATAHPPPGCPRTREVPTPRARRAGHRCMEFPVNAQPIPGLYPGRAPDLPVHGPEPKRYAPYARCLRTPARSAPRRVRSPRRSRPSTMKIGRSGCAFPGGGRGRRGRPSPPNSTDAT